MSYLYYSIILFCPLIAAILIKLTLDQPLWSSITSAYYLFFAYTVVYIGAMMLLISLINVVIPPFWNFMLFIVMYFVFFFLRTYLYTESSDIFENKTVHIGK